MNKLLLLLLPAATALTAWVTSRVMLYMVLYPLTPKSLLGFTFQGIIIKSQPAIAAKIAEGVAAELSGENGLQLADPATIKSLQPLIEQHLDSFLHVKLKEKMPVISSFIGNSTIGKLKEGMMEEIELLLPEVIAKYTASIANDASLKTKIAERISSYPATKIEEQLGPTLKMAMRRVPLLFALAGFVVGLVLSVVAFCACQ